MIRIATIHHLSSSGGTIISKVVASLNNVVFLSEINPRELRQSFTPFDPVAQFFKSKNHQPSDETLCEIFLERFRYIVSNLDSSERLVVRDHSHSDFLWELACHPVLREWLALDYNLKSACTLRHPLDAWLSMVESGFNKELSGFQEYCDRYTAFLDFYADVALVRYEDFVLSPSQVLESLCGYLDLPFEGEALESFSNAKLSGDSGRGRTMVTIEPLERRHVPTELAASLPSLPTYQAICERLGYDPDPARPPLT